MQLNPMERQAPVDYFSNVLQELQMQIMSILPRKDVTKTSVLSTAWNHFWLNWKNRFPYPTSLEFTPPYRGEDSQAKCVRAETERLQSYKNESKKIEKYKMNFNPGDRHEKTLMRIIRTSISCGVEELDLNFSQGFQSQTVNGGMLGSRRKKPELKEKNFEGNSIAHLSLAYCRLNQHFRFTKFPHVQFLHFYGVNINESKLAQIVQNCGALETLVLTECFQLKNVRFNNFPILQLRNLIFERCPSIEGIHIIAPNLRKFHFIGYLPENIQISGTRLEEVVWISTLEMNHYRGNNFWPTFASERRIQRLSMCNVGMQHLFGPSRLDNLRVISFKLHQFWDSDIMDFYRLFNRHNVPLLRSLIIEFPNSDPIPPLEPQFDNVTVMEPAPQLNFESLYQIKMKNFDGRIQQLSLLNFFLSRAINLVVAQLVPPPNFDTKNLSWSMMNIVTWAVATSRVGDADVIVDSPDSRFVSIP